MSSSTADPSLLIEKPQNGVAGLKHWRQDMTAGLLVSLVSLPLSLGIAVASGAPPIAGLISAIIAGLIYPFLGGSYLTISGPAAGLAPALMASMLTLGHGDLVKGYPLLLGAIFLTGCVQIVLSRIHAAKFSALFPAAVIEGMLAAIGMLIIAKQLPNLIGHEYRAHEFFGYILETPEEILLMEPKVFLIGLICLAFIFVLGLIKIPRIKMVPPPLLVVLLGIALGQAFGLDSKYFIHVPENVFEHGIVVPDFQSLATNNEYWLPVLTIVVTLTLIDGVESLATAAAIDKIDPWQRRSDPNRTLLSMGISNICSSLAGGLTIIPGGVKSKACIVGGGRTLWANFYNAMFLVLFLFAAQRLINMIPLSALAAVLMYTGWKLCEPKVWKHIAHIGREQLFVFCVTVLATLLTDLLWGIFIGMGIKLAVSVLYTWPAARDNIVDQPVRFGGGVLSTVRQMSDLFRNPVTLRETQDDTYHLFFGRPLVCFNALHVNNELEKIPADAHNVFLHITEGVSLIDHTTCDKLITFALEYKQTGRGDVEIVGLENLFMRSEHSSCMRVNSPRRVPARLRNSRGNSVMLHVPATEVHHTNGQAVAEPHTSSVPEGDRVPLNIQNLSQTK